MTLHVITRREEKYDDDEPFSHLPPDMVDELECPIGCNGWSECNKAHEVPGYDGVNDGPWDSYEDAPWYDQEEFEFHGVVHTWSGNGYGWTVPYNGCVVAGNDWSDPYGVPDRPGKWLVDDDWDDTTVSLTKVCELDDGVARGTLVRPMRERGPNEYTPRAVASYLRSQNVPNEYAQAFAKEFWLEGRPTAVTLSVPAALLASQHGIPAEYAHAADAYASLFTYGETRAQTIIELHTAGVDIEYIRLGMTHRVEPSVLIESSRNGVPADFLAELAA